LYNSETRAKQHNTQQTESENNAKNISPKPGPQLRLVYNSKPQSNISKDLIKKKKTYATSDGPGV
jgi:hypothetical protein